jgi:hypothetical protein
MIFAGAPFSPSTARIVVVSFMRLAGNEGNDRLHAPPAKGINYRVLEQNPFPRRCF